METRWAKGLSGLLTLVALLPLAGCSEANRDAEPSVTASSEPSEQGAVIASVAPTLQPAPQESDRGVRQPARGGYVNCF